MKHTKKALFTSVIALILCFTMLLGTTYAWFTDTVTSAGNRIVSGSLKIDLLHLVDDEWISLKQQPEHKVFDYDLWEPGYTQVESLKIKNAGNLAFKYQMNVTAEAGTVVFGENGEYLANVIDVYMCFGESTATDFDDIANSWQKMGTLADLMAAPGGFTQGKMLPEGATVDQEGAAIGEQTASIALHMQESAGNEYQNLSVGDLYITLLATQWTYEEDSFDDDYDRNATYSHIVTDLEVSANITGKVIDGKLTEAVVLSDAASGITATVPVGTAVEGMTLTLKLTEDDVDENITLDKTVAYDVNVEGVEENNTAPIVIVMPKALPKEQSAIQLFHAGKAMMRVYTVAALSEKDGGTSDTYGDRFLYDAATGDVSFSLTHFSNVSLAATTSIIVNGEAYTGFTEITIEEDEKKEITIPADGNLYVITHNREDYTTKNPLSQTITHTWYNINPGTYSASNIKVEKGAKVVLNGVNIRTSSGVDALQIIPSNKSAQTYIYIADGTNNWLTGKSGIGFGNYIGADVYIEGRGNIYATALNWGCAAIGVSDHEDGNVNSMHFNVCHLRAIPMNNSAGIGSGGNAWRCLKLTEFSGNGLYQVYSGGNAASIGGGINVDWVGEIVVNDEARVHCYNQPWTANWRTMGGGTYSGKCNGVFVASTAYVNNYYNVNANVIVKGFTNLDSITADSKGDALTVIGYFGGEKIELDASECKMSADGTKVTASAVYGVADGETEPKVYYIDGVSDEHVRSAEITVIELEDKFQLVFPNTDTYLYRVGNQNDITLSSLFKETKEVDDASVRVTFESVVGANGTYTSNTGDWTKGTVKFSGTGIVKVTIKSDDAKAKTLVLEVVDAVNATGKVNATENNVVLLKDISGGFTVSNGYAFYGNGFKVSCGGDGSYREKTGMEQGFVTVEKGGILDNIQLYCDIFPVSALYTSDLGDYTTDASGVNRYKYQFSAVTISGDSTISNCYIKGARNNIFVGGGNVTISNTITECGSLSNIQINKSSSDYTVTLDNVTTIQYQTTSNYDTSKKVLGCGVVVGTNESTSNPTIKLTGDFRQYNWVTSADTSVSNTYAKAIINSALNETAYKHTVNGANTVNIGIVYLNNLDAIVIDERDTDVKNAIPYKLNTVTIAISGINISGKVCSVAAGSAVSAESRYNSTADGVKPTDVAMNALYIPQKPIDKTLGGQYIQNVDGQDEFCYNDGGTIKVMFVAGDTKKLNVAKLLNIAKYTGRDLGIEITCKDDEGNAVPVIDGIVTLSEQKDYMITYKVTDRVFYDKLGNPIDQTRVYTWDLPLSVTLKDTALPDAEFEFDSSKQVIYRSGNSNIVQFMPFLAGLKIYDYVGQERYLRFDGDNDYAKIAKATINNINTSGEAQGYHIITVELVDGGKLVIDLDVRANSGGSTHSGSIKVRSNVLYVVNGGTTSGKGQTWKVYSYKFVGNNGVEINSGLVTFGTAGVDCDTATKPSSNFSTTIKYTVTYDANGGNCGQTTGYATSASAAVTLPTPTRSGYAFLGWYTAVSGGTRVGGAGSAYTPSANVTLYARWGQPSTVTYNANGGSCDVSSEKYIGIALKLPTPQLDGSSFKGWYTAPEGGTLIGGAGETYEPTGDITLYAQWGKPVTVTYNANGGSVSSTSQTVAEGNALKLPTPTLTGYKCTGWYTAASGGTKAGDAGESYVPTADITLYAQWQINSYTITVTTNNATVKVNGTTVNNNGTVSIQYGAQVTVEVTYSESNDQSTTIKGTDGTTYTSPFTMPAQNVMINATSSGCVTPDTLITLANGTKKRVDSLTGNELLLVWNLKTGKYDAAPIVFVDSEAEAEYNIIHLTFSDGSDVKVIYEHGFFDIDLGRYVYIDESNYHNYVGHRFVREGDIDKDSWEIVTLINARIKKEVTTAWSPVSAEHLCYFTNGVLSMPGGIEGLFNIFEVDTDTMSYDKEKMAQDIETYGLFTLEDFGGMITEDAFYAFNGAYLKVAIGKGLLTWEEIAYLAQRYIPLM